MSESLPEYRMAQNQVVFRKTNQRIQEGFDQLKAMSEEDGATPIEADPDMLLKFVCECADENCTERLNLTLGEYNSVHKTTKHFVVSHGHNVPKIEDIVLTEKGYIVVRKHEEPPLDAERPVDSGIDNTK